MNINSKVLQNDLVIELLSLPLVRPRLTNCLDLNYAPLFPVPTTLYSDPSSCGVARDLTLPGSLLWLIHRYLLFLPPLNFHPTIVPVLEPSTPLLLPHLALSFQDLKSRPPQRSTPFLLVHQLLGMRTRSR